MLVVLPVCHKDIKLAERILQWCVTLDRNPFDLLIASESGTDTSTIKPLAEKCFRRVTEFVYDAHTGDMAWPRPQNHAWQTVARHVPKYQQPWFWWEPDVTPLRSGWAEMLAREYYTSGKPFMGHVVSGRGHMNGVAVYPSDVAQHVMDALICRSSPWDVMLTREISGKVHAANHLIAHMPRFTGVQLSCKDPDAVRKLLDKGYLLFHGCNDGSLADLLQGLKPPQTIFRKVIRWFTARDLDMEIDEAESAWQHEALALYDKGYGVVPWHDVARPVQPFTQQTEFETGLFQLPLGTNECHFNPGLVRAMDRLWLVSRRWNRLHNGPWHSALVAWKLDDELYPHQPVELKFPKYSGVEQYEDPRVVWHAGLFWVAYCTWRHGRLYRAHQSLSAFNSGWQFQQTVNVAYGGNGFYPGSGTHHEKNWLWFRHNDRWHIVYQFHPHIVLEYDSGTPLRMYRSVQATPLPWLHGEIRGGTPPVRVKDEYVSFFHSSLFWKGRKKRFYMGAYAFSAKPPFAVTRMTREPILSGSEQDTRINDGPPCIYPCGAFLDQGHWLVSFGVNDEACGWIRIPEDKLKLEEL